MLSKSLLSLAIAASLVGMSGCNISSTADNNTVDSTPVEAGTPAYIGENFATIGTTYPLFNPAKTLPTGLPEIPVTSDLLYQGPADSDGADGTLPLTAGEAPLGDAAYNPIFNAAADMDGFSTTGQIDIPFSAGIDAASVIGSGADATVFVIPLSYGSEDPLLSSATPTPGLPVAIDASVITFASSTVNADSYTLINGAASGQGNVLRISPTTPLDPATRYIIVLTNAIKDSNGKAVIAAPTYTLLSSPSEFLTGTDADTLSKAALQDAIQGYEAAASGIFAATGYGYNADNIVYSFSFTTGGTTAVLDSMAAPANYVASAVSAEAGAAFNITLPSQYRFLMEQTIQASAADVAIATATGVVHAQLVADEATTVIDAATGLLQGTAAAVLTALGEGTVAQQTSLGALATIHSAIPSPTARVTNFDTTGVNFQATLGFGDANTRISNGTITIPQYTTDFTFPNDLTASYSANVASAAFGFWGSDATLGADLEAVLAAAGVPAAAVAAPSGNVTRLFPLADVVQYVDVPVTVFYNTACAGQYTPVIYIHGIGSKRSAAVGVGDELGKEGDNCLATVAIDLPKHGLTDSATDTALRAAFGNETLEAQRHYGLKRLGSSPVPMTDAYVDGLTAAQDAAGLAAIDAALAAATGDELVALQASEAVDRATVTGTAAGTNAAIKAESNTDASGDFFINLENFQSMRDNLRSSVLDNLNLNASLEFMDFDGVAGADFDSSEVHLLGHSLGAIIAVNVASVNNRVGAGVADCTTCNNMLPEITTVTLGNPGGGIVSLLENSQAFGETIVQGIEAIGLAGGLDLSQGSFLYELTKNITQGTIDSGDPINFAAPLAATDTPVLAFQMIGGTGDAVSDTVIPTNALAANVLTLVDQPAAAEAEDQSDVARSYSALPAFLSGSDGVIAELNLSQVTASVDGDTSLKAVVKFTDGNHGSFSNPLDAQFTEVMSQTASFIRSTGQDITIAGDAPVTAL